MFGSEERKGEEGRGIADYPVFILKY